MLVVSYNKFDIYLSPCFSHPDVFMESYLENPVAPLFFVVYLLITFYYLSNLVRVTYVCLHLETSHHSVCYSFFSQLLAVVFAKFKDEDKKKYKKLYMHRR